MVHDEEPSGQDAERRLELELPRFWTLLGWVFRRRARGWPPRQPAPGGELARTDLEPPTRHVPGGGRCVEGQERMAKGLGYKAGRPSVGEQVLASLTFRRADGRGGLGGGVPASVGVQPPGDSTGRGRIVVGIRGSSPPWSHDCFSSPHPGPRKDLAKQNRYSKDNHNPQMCSHLGIYGNNGGRATPWRRRP